MAKKSGKNEKKDALVNPKSEDEMEESPKEDNSSKEKKDSSSKEKKANSKVEDIILKVHMDCEGCTHRVLRSLRGFDGVEEIEIDDKNHKVVVKGKNADPLDVLERVKKKCGKHVELISPIRLKPKQPTEAKKEEKKQPKVMIVVLKVYMHCDACAVEIKRSIWKMEGIRTVEADRESSTVTVRGVFDPPKLVEHLGKRAGKHAVILKQEEEKREEKKPKKEKKEKEKEKEKEETNKKTEIKEGIQELWGNEIDSNFFHYHSHYPCQHLYPHQFFSEENSNACSIM